MNPSSRKRTCAHTSRSRSFRLLSGIGGIAALVWLALRSGSKPSRLAYPCQQAALSTASLAFGASIIAALVALRRRASAVPKGPWIALACVISLAALPFLWGWVQRPPAYAGPILGPPSAYTAEVYHVTACPQDPVGDRFPGLDELIEMMGGHGLKFYRSDVPSLVAGPGGIVGAADVIVIKINYQWPERGGTNTDLLRGLIRRIVDHPDGFSGEVVVAENAQFRSTEGLDRAENNAQDVAQSPHDVVTVFRNAGHRVSHYDWTPIRTTQVNEYSAGDMNDGYIVGPWDSIVFGRLSYPKFRTDFGTRISLKYGVWTEESGYDRAKLRYINVPVLKSHHSTYGATAAVKNYMGTVTGELGTNSHLAIGQGILGKLMADDVGLADLNLLDCIWINANPNTGPATTYEGATRRDELVAGLDPIATDMWAVKNILIPAFEANGHSPPWPTPSADPDDPGSAFRRYLDASMYHLLNAGHEVTNDLSQIDEVATLPPGEVSQPGGGGAPFRIDKVEGGFDLSWSAPVRGGTVQGYNLYRTVLGTGGSAAPECEAFLGTGTTTFLPSLPGGHGFLVVARNDVGDGSFGTDSSSRERPSPTPAQVCP